MASFVSVALSILVGRVAQWNKCQTCYRKTLYSVRISRKKRHGRAQLSLDQKADVSGVN